MLTGLVIPQPRLKPFVVDFRQNLDLVNDTGVIGMRFVVADIIFFSNW